MRAGLQRAVDNPDGYRSSDAVRSGAQSAERAASISVAIPCFNDGETVEAAAASVLAGATTVELVVVDDGSTDAETRSALKRLEGRGLRVIRQQRMGPSAATMSGFRATSSDYFMRFDADDLLEPLALEDLARSLDANPRAAIAWGDVQTFGVTDFRIPGIRAMDPWFVTYTNCVTGAGWLTRRDAIIAIGGWQVNDGWEDWDLWMSLAERGYEGIYVPRVVFRYRRERARRHAESLVWADAYYADLRRRHQALFVDRAKHRRASDAPWILRVLAPMIDSVPGLPRLTKIHICELLGRLFWGAGVRATIPMIVQASRIRMQRVREP